MVKYLKFWGDDFLPAKN